MWGKKERYSNGYHEYNLNYPTYNSNLTIQKFDTTLEKAYKEKWGSNLKY